MIESHAVLEVSDGILNLGVAAMVGLQLQGIPVPVGVLQRVWGLTNSRRRLPHGEGRDARAGGIVRDGVM